MMHIGQEVFTIDGRVGTVKTVQKIVFGDYQAQMCYVAGERFGNWYLDRNDNGQLFPKDEGIICHNCKTFIYI